MEKTCGLYVRVSTDNQVNVKNGSLDTQESRLKQYVGLRNSSDDTWDVAGVYREEGKSGKNTERPQLQRLIQDIQSGLINTVLCTKIDRITRSLIDFYHLLEVFQEQNVDFVSLDESVETSTPFGKAVTKILLVFAELEREQTSKRTREKMAWRAEQGLWNGGQVLGYDIIDGELRINEEEADLVRLIFEMYVQLGSAHSVANWLNDHGYRTKAYTSRRGRQQGGGKFYNTSIINKIKSKTYLGEIEYRGKCFEGKHEAIVDREVAEKANRLLSEHAPKRKNFRHKRKYTYLLQGLVRCGYCGAYMTPKYSTGRNGLHFYYQCTKNSHGGNKQCRMRYVAAGDLERTVINQIKELSIAPDVTSEVVEKANALNAQEIESARSSLLSIRNEKSKLNEQIESILSLMMDTGEAHPSMRDKLARLEERKAQLNDERSRMKAGADELAKQTLNAQALSNTLFTFGDIVNEATDQELKDLLPTVVESVVFTPEEIKIALFDHFVEESFVNHSSSGALELSEWLRR